MLKAKGKLSKPKKLSKTTDANTSKSLQQICQYIRYYPLTGALYCLGRPSVNDVDVMLPDRKIQVDETNKIATTIRGYTLKIKADRLIWFLTTGKQPQRNQIVFHKNLDELDNSLTNLVLLSKKEYFRVLEAMKNISGDLKLIPHKTDMFSFTLQYKDNGRINNVVIQDLLCARREFNKVQLRSIKLISKYTISD